MKELARPSRATAPRNRRNCRANRQRITNAVEVFTQTLSQAATEGFFGEVRVYATFQDGVVQSVTVERSQVMR